MIAKKISSQQIEVDLQLFRHFDMPGEIEPCPDDVLWGQSSGAKNASNVVKSQFDLFQQPVTDTAVNRGADLAGNVEKAADALELESPTERADNRENIGRIVNLKQVDLVC